MELIYNDAEVISGLQRLRDRVGNIRPALAEIGEAMAESTKQRFGTTTGPDGGLWAANSQVTLDHKPGSIPLTGVSGALRDTIHSQLDGDFAVEIGSDRDQAAMMQFGGTKDEFPHLWGDIPAREYLGVSNQDKVVILGIIERYLNF
jgi:phage virion morphogenesis protein